MRRKLTVYMIEGEPDALGNNENVKTSVMFVGDESFMTLTFGGRDGSSNEGITIDELRSIFDKVGKEG